MSQEKVSSEGSAAVDSGPLGIFKEAVRAYPILRVFWIIIAISSVYFFAKHTVKDVEDLPAVAIYFSSVILIVLVMAGIAKNVRKLKIHGLDMLVSITVWIVGLLLILATLSFFIASIFPGAQITNKVVSMIDNFLGPQDADMDTVMPIDPALTDITYRKCVNGVSLGLNLDEYRAEIFRCGDQLEK